MRFMTFVLHDDKQSPFYYG
jgi:hypothetical protein